MVSRRELLILPPIADAPSRLVVLCSKPIELGGLLRGLLLERLCFDTGLRCVRSEQGVGHTEIPRFSLFLSQLFLQSRDLVAAVLLRFFLTSTPSVNAPREWNRWEYTDPLLEYSDFLFDFSVFFLSVDEVQDDRKCAGENEREEKRESSQVGISLRTEGGRC